MLPYTISQNSITILLGGIPKVVDSSHPNYPLVLEAIKSGNDEIIASLIDVAKAIETYGAGNVTISGGVVYFNGAELHNYAVDKLLELMSEGFDINPLVNFLSNLMENPSYKAVQELYKFLEVGGIPITEDGHFVVYKKVRDDYKDIYSGSFDNSVGTAPSMPRNMVDEDSNRTCSNGLHVCSYSYLDSFGTSAGNRVVACKVNPKDVVAIPADYNNTKMRVSRYEVIEDVTHHYTDRKDVLREAKVYKEPVKDTPSKFGNTAKPVMLVKNAKGKVVNVSYLSASDAEVKTGIFATNITKVCRGIRSKAGGCTWKYI